MQRSKQLNNSDHITNGKTRSPINSVPGKPFRNGKKMERWDRMAPENRIRDGCPFCFLRNLLTEEDYDQKNSK